MQTKELRAFFHANLAHDGNNTDVLTLQVGNNIDTACVTKIEFPCITRDDILAMIEELKDCLALAS